VSFPRYPVYKDSGEPTLGEIPSDWRIVRVGDVARVVNGYPFDARLFDDAGTYPLIRIRDLGASDTATRYSGEFIESAAVSSSDVLIGMDGDFNVGRWKGTGPALLNQRMCCIRASSSVVVRYLEFVLPGSLRIINDLTYATTVKHLSSSQVEKIRVALPTTDDELICVVDFLDRETAKIDALVAEQEQLITLLKEKRQAVISHAVTKGLDPSVPMKDSGVEWLGEVPAHWEISRLKNMSPEVTVGIVVEPSKYYCEDGTPALRSLNVTPMDIRQEGYVYISAESNELLTKSKLRAGDLVAVRSGQPGTTAVVPNELDGSNCIDLIIIRKPLADDARFMAWYLNSDAAIRQFTEGSGGAIQQHFNVGTAMNLLLTRPPADEQKRIAAEIDRDTRKIDLLLSEAVLSIELLIERRSALISAAVTGQIDVRGLALAPEPAA
jgi:type I restriction enzyme, S subunit